MSARETSTYWLNRALKEPPFSDERLYCIRQAERREAPRRRRGRPQGNGLPRSDTDGRLLLDMEDLAKATGETKARKLARIALDHAIEAGKVQVKAGPWYSTTVERLAALYRKTGGNFWAFWEERVLE